MRILVCFSCSLLLACGSGAGSHGDGDGDGDGAGRVDQLVRGDIRTRLILEIDSVVGSEPDSRASQRVTALLGDLLDKPGGITNVETGTLDSRGSDYAWTNAELFALADEQIESVTDSDAATIHVMFLDGHSARDGAGGTVLGLAWANRHLVMFKESIRRACSASGVPPLLREELCLSAEVAIWTHELGHVIGVVDAGLEMVTNHKDEEHGAHDSSDECVMYWAYDGSAIIDVLLEQLIAGDDASIDFDDECLADIAARRDQ